MSRKTVKEIFIELYERYHQASKRLKTGILNELCTTTRRNRKYAIRKLNGPPPDEAPVSAAPRRRGCTYSVRVIEVLTKVWDVAGYPCGIRLKALVPRWLPHIRERFPLTPDEVRQLLAISARQMDRRLAPKKKDLRKRLYGRTKPGTLLKARIPIKTEHWDVTAPGFTEIDTVAHCGNSAEGLFASTVNQTDILTTWVESRVVLGKGEQGVVAALDEMRQAVPFLIQGYDSDSGGEFVNWHLVRYCEAKGISPTRSRPYKKNDQAHVEQKNWTHVRKLFGWDRYDTPAAVVAMNALYREEWSWLMNLFLPSMKLVKKERVGSRVRRRYDTPQTPLDRVIASQQGNPRKVAALLRLRNTLDPFVLSATIERHVKAIGRLASQHVRVGPATPAVPREKNSLTTREEDTLRTVARLVGSHAETRDTHGASRDLALARSEAS